MRINTKDERREELARYCEKVVIETNVKRRGLSHQIPPNRLNPSLPVKRFLLGEILSRDLQLQATFKVTKSKASISKEPRARSMSDD